MGTETALDLSDLTYDYFKNGEQLRRQVAREVLSNTSIWADIAFLHQDRDLSTDGWKPAKVTIVRFKKINGSWKKQNHLNVNSAGRVDGIIRVLEGWRGRIGADDVPEE